MRTARRFDTSRNPFGARPTRTPMSERTLYYHRVLGVAPGSGKAAVRRAYHALARIYHPDVNPVGAERMRLLNEAYRHLTTYL